MAKKRKRTAAKKHKPELLAVAFEPDDKFIDELCGIDESLATSFKQAKKRGNTWLGVVVDKGSGQPVLTFASTAMFTRESPAQRRAQRHLNNYLNNGSYTEDDEDALKPVSMSFTPQKI